MNNSQKMRRTIFFIINGVTLYRLVTAPVLVALVVLGHFSLFKWLLLVSFITDAIDGFMARRYKISSAFGAHLDSIADDCTILAAIIGIWIWDALFLIYQFLPIAILLLLYLVQNLLALSRYKRPTSFHTYLAKAAAVIQAAFLITFFFLPDPVYWLFYLMIGLTIADLLEEIILVVILPGYRTNVKGLYWVLSRRRARKFNN